MNIENNSFNVDRITHYRYDARMETRVIQLDLLDDLRGLYRDVAAQMLEGDIVALPTETVYGLGADALNADAVARVFEAKERPSYDPLICHLPNGRSVHDIADVPEELKDLVKTLAKEFWPGPMTLVLPKKDIIPDIVTSGLPTVACRVPAHDVMRGVAKALDRPIAAPSANRFGHISPTSAGAVLKELDGRIPLILDAGACSEGIESTILAPCIDEKGNPAVRLLREGPVTREMLRPICRVIRPKKLSKRAQALAEEAAKEAAANPSASVVPNPEAPGQLESHYAPTKPLYLCAPREKFEAQEDIRYGLISYQGDSKLSDQDCWEEVLTLSPGNGRLSEAALRLFALMRQMDENEDIDVIIVEELPETGIGCAMMDRLRRASSKRS
ncbi:MAG: L-threonylcarbamoyladenylate synthase [Akkermansia sp.]